MAHTFNGSLKRIYIDSALPNVVVQDLYSDWKEWAVQGSNLMFEQAFRTFGGDPTVEGQSAPAYYFLTNGWRCVVDGFDATFSYNLYTNEGEQPVITLNGGTALLNNSDVGIVKTEFDKEQDYNGVVHINFVIGSSGTEYPLGTSAEPVDNFADAITIAEIYGINQIHIDKGTGTADVDLTDYLVVGTNSQSCGVIMTGDQNGIYKNAKFINITITGTACGCPWYADSCSLKDVYSIAGYFKECGISETIHLSKEVNTDTGLLNESVFYQCVSEVPGFGSPTLDMVQGYPTRASFRGYSGGLVLKYADHADDTATFEYIAGKLTIDVSCTAGEVSVRGMVKVTDNSNGLTVDDSATASQLVDLSNATESLNEESLHNALDSYANKDNWKGLTLSQEQDIIDTNLRAQTLETDISNIKSAVNLLPTLLDIEQSTILAKKSDISVVEAIVSTLPDLSEIRNEMINVTFGGLEIANNQLTIKDKEGVVIAIFDLFDKNGNPTMLSVFKREVSF